MIKVEVYNYRYSFENEEPEMVLTLKEFEEKFNNKDEDYDFNPQYIKFVIA